MSIRTVRMLAAMALGATACIAHAQAIVMRISHPLPPAHHIAQLLEKFAADVKASTQGRVQVQLFGAEQAFKANQNHAAVARHQIEAAVVTNFQWGGTIPEMNVTSIPYFMSGLDKIQRFPGSEAAHLLEGKLEEKGVKNIAWLYDSRFAIFTSQKAPLAQIDDFKGVKIRGLSKLVDGGFRAAGSSPVTMNAGEMYQALQTGVLDAAITDVSAGYSRRLYEVQKYGVVSPFFVVYFHMFVNPQWWAQLPTDVKQGIEAAAHKAEKEAVPLTEQTAKRAIAQLRENHMQVIVHDEAQAEAFRKVMEPPVMQDFLQTSPDARKLVDLVNQLSQNQSK